MSTMNKTDTYLRCTSATRHCWMGVQGRRWTPFSTNRCFQPMERLGTCYMIPSYMSIYIYLFCQKIDKFRALSDELALLRQTAYLNLFSLDCKELNLLLAKKAMDLAERLVAALVVKNRDLNKEYVPVIMRTTTTTMTIACLFIAVFVIAMTTYQTRFMKILGAQRRWCS